MCLRANAPRRRDTRAKRNHVVRIVARGVVNERAFLGALVLGRWLILVLFYGPLLVCGRVAWRAETYAGLQWREPQTMAAGTDLTQFCKRPFLKGVRRCVVIPAEVLSSG